MGRLAPHQPLSRWGTGGNGLFVDDRSGYRADVSGAISQWLSTGAGIRFGLAGQGQLAGITITTVTPPAGTAWASQTHLTTADGSPQQILHAEIELNASKVSGDSGARQTTIAHALGAALGLPNATESCAVMSDTVTTDSCGDQAWPCGPQNADAQALVQLYSGQVAGTFQPAHCSATSSSRATASITT